MTRRMVRTFNLCAVCFIVLVVAVLQMPGKAYSMVMSPYKIVLNSELAGKNQDIQAIIHDARGCANIVSFDLVLYIEGVPLQQIAEAYAVRYCVLDQNFLISFHRENIHDYFEEVINGGELLSLEVRVEGTVTLDCNGDGVPDDPPITLTGNDTIDIVDPGQKPEQEEESEVNLRGRSD